MEDVTSLEDSPGGKKGHFIIHFGQMHMHLKSDDVSVKNKWLATITKLWNHYKAIADPREKNGSGKNAHDSPISIQTSPNHYKSKQIDPRYLLEIAASHQEQKIDPKVSQQIRAKLKECMIQNSLDILEPRIIDNHMFAIRMKLARGRSPSLRKCSIRYNG